MHDEHDCAVRMSCGSAEQIKRIPTWSSTTKSTQQQTRVVTENSVFWANVPGSVVARFCCAVVEEKCYQ